MQTPSLSILVLEDDDLVRKSLNAILKSLGHRPTLASSGEAAVEEFQRHSNLDTRFDLALLDMTVAGGMGGHQTMVRLRELKAQFPMIAMSGYAPDHDAEGEPQFDGYLQKPFSAMQLKQSIEMATRANRPQHPQ